MSWWLLAILFLAGVPVLIYGAYLLLFWAAAQNVPALILDVWFFGFGVRRVYVHERHWLARLLPGWGQSNHPHVYLDGVLWEKGRPWRQGIDPPVTQAWQLAHEIGHCPQKLGLGEPRYGVGAVLEIPLHGTHRDRPREQEAWALQHAIAIGGCPTVKVLGLTLARQFENWNDPDDPSTWTPNSPWRSAA